MLLVVAEFTTRSFSTGTDTVHSLQLYWSMLRGKKSLNRLSFEWSLADGSYIYHPFYNLKLHQEELTSSLVVVCIKHLIRPKPQKAIASTHRLGLSCESQQEELLDLKVWHGGSMSQDSRLKLVCHLVYVGFQFNYWKVTVQNTHIWLLPFKFLFWTCTAAYSKLDRSFEYTNMKYLKKMIWCKWPSFVMICFS